MNKVYEDLMKHIDKAVAIGEAISLYEWDSLTLAPEKATTNTSKTIGILSNEYFSRMVNDEVKTLISLLCTSKEQKKLNFNQKAIVKCLKKTYEKLEPIPPEEYQANSELIAKATSIWTSAKRNKDFSEFAPTLKEIIGYQKKFAGYRAKEGQKLYDVLLNDYEEGFNMEQLDLFFNKIKTAIIPLIKEVAQKDNLIDKSYNSLEYDVKKQKEFCRYLAGYVGFDFNKGVIAESAHPFTLQLHNKDVRITDHFYKDNLESGIFSMIHETGHALYEMNIDDAITQTLVGSGTSMGMHEAQSRFFENMIGRREAFWEPVYPKLKETFSEQLKDITLKQFVRGVNKSVPALVRTEADELTYSLHIIIRYEIEKMIFSNEVSVEDLPEVWNKKYEEYLGITPSNDAEGILQDVHWAGGDFGYFASYALGSALAAQIYCHMKKTMPIETYLREGNLEPIREYLTEHIYQYGATMNTDEILMATMKESLNADYYIRYLTEKYTDLYGL